jgi:branched-chain amino acid aminotransferase
MPVARVDGRPLGAGRPGPITTRFRTAYWDRREAGGLGTPVKDLVA